MSLLLPSAQLPQHMPLEAVDRVLEHHVKDRVAYQDLGLVLLQLIVRPLVLLLAHLRVQQVVHQVQLLVRAPLRLGAYLRLGVPEALGTHGQLEQPAYLGLDQRLRLRLTNWPAHHRLEVLPPQRPLNARKKAAHTFRLLIPVINKE